jgi:hypothetical protein
MISPRLPLRQIGRLQPAALGAILTEDAPSSVRPRRASAVQPPDRENARESNPDRERHETPSRHPIEPLEPDDRGENDQNLRNNVDHAQQRIVGAEERPQPRRIGTN